MRAVTCTGPSYRSTSSTAPAAERGIGDEAIPLAAVAQHGDHAVADEVGGGLVAGDEEQQHDRAQLLLGEAIALLLDGEQRR